MQLRLVAYPIIYKVYTSQVVVWDFWTIKSSRRKGDIYPGPQAKKRAMSVFGISSKTWIYNLHQQGSDFGNIWFPPDLPRLPDALQKGRVQASVRQFGGNMSYQ